jgi:hypothetical protein
MEALLATSDGSVACYLWWKIPVLLLMEALLAKLCMEEARSKQILLLLTPLEKSCICGGADAKAATRCFPLVAHPLN